METTACIFSDPEDKLQSSGEPENVVVGAKVSVNTYDEVNDKTRRIRNVI